MEDTKHTRIVVSLLVVVPENHDDIDYFDTAHKIGKLAVKAGYRVAGVRYALESDNV